MMRNFLATLCVVVFIFPLAAQKPEYKIQSASYYRTHPYPSVNAIIMHVKKQLYYAVADTGVYYTLAKKPDGYYLVKEYYTGGIKSSELCWSLTHNRYMDIVAQAGSKPSNIDIMTNDASYQHNLFFGYPGWYEDVMKVYPSEKDLNCDEAQYLARAYDMKSNSILFNNKADNTYREELYAKQRSEAEVEEVVKWRLAAIKQYEKSAELCPEKDRLVGSATFKVQNIYMAFYYDLMLLGYTKQAKQFLDKAYFEPFYVNTGKNLLNQCEQNGILFVGGDSDTYLCVYAQDKLNFRKDVVIVNTSLAQTGWYISYLKNERKIKTVQPLEFYCNPQSVIMYKRGISYDGITFEKLCEKINQGHHEFVHESYLTLPATVVTAGQYTMNYSKTSYLSRYDLFLLDLLTSNPELPVYFSGSVGEDYYECLSKYAVMEGLSFKIDLDYEKYQETDKVNLEKFRKHMIDQLIWDDIRNSKLHDMEKSRFAYHYRDHFAQYVSACIIANQHKDAIIASEKIFAIIPDEIIAYDRAIAKTVSLYYSIGDKATAKKVADLCARQVELSYAKYKAKIKCTEDLKFEYYSACIIADALSRIEGYARAEEMKTIFDEMYEGLMELWNECD